MARPANSGGNGLGGVGADLASAQADFGIKPVGGAVKVADRTFDFDAVAVREPAQ
jgi:hypothetical protein